MSQLSSSAPNPSPALTDPPVTSSTQSVQSQQEKGSPGPAKTPSRTPPSRKASARPTQSQRTQQSWSLRHKLLAWALGVSFVPVLAMGGLTYFSTQVLQRQLSQVSSSTATSTTAVIQRQQQLLLVGAGGIAVVAGAIAALITNRTLRSVLTAATTSTHLVNRLRQEELDARARAGGQDELVALSANLDILDQELPHLLSHQEAEGEPFAVLRILAQDLRTARSQEEVLRLAVTEARSVLRVDRVVFFRFNADGGGTFIEASVAPGWPQLVWSSIQDPRLEDKTMVPYLEGEVQAVDNIYTAGFSDDHIGVLERFGIQADLIAPVLKGNDLFGLLIAHQCSGPRQWQQPEIDLWGQIAVQIGFCLDNASLVAQAHARSEQIQQVANITQQIRTALSPEDILNTLVEAVRQALRTDRVVVCRFDVNGCGTIAAESVLPGFTKALLTQIQDTCFRDEGFVEKYELGHIQVNHDVYTAGLSDCHLKQLEYFGVKANLVAPILVQNQLYGLLIAHQCARPRTWTQTEIDLLVQSATQAGFALDQAQLVARMDADTGRINRLGTMLQSIQTSLNTTDILNTAVTGLHQALQTDRVLVYELDAQWNGTVVAEAISPGFPKTLGMTIASPGLAERLPEPSAASPVVAISDIYEAGLSQRHQAQLERLAVEAILIVPLFCQDNQLYGLLMAHQCNGPRSWRQGDVDLFAQVSAQVTFALDQMEQAAQTKQNYEKVQATLQQQQQGQAAQQQQITAVLKNSDKVKALSAGAFNEMKLVDTLYEHINGITQTAKDLLPDLKQGVLQGQVINQTLQQEQQSVDAIQASFTDGLEAIVMGIAKIQALSQPIQELEGTLTLMADLSTQLKLQATNATLEAGRSGDAGHSFAAIGEQVHSLTRQLEAGLIRFPPLVSAIKAEAEEALTKMTWGQQQTSEGKRWSSETQHHLQQVVIYHQQMGVLVEQVAQVVANQATQSISTSQTIVELANLTSQVSEQSAQIANAFDQLKDVCPVD